MKHPIRALLYLLIWIALTQALSGRISASSVQTRCPDFVSPPGVNTADIQAIAAQWLRTSGGPGWDARMDLDDDGSIDIADILLTAAAWGSACVGVPPDPAAVAPPLDLTVSSRLPDLAAFLYTGPDPIQTGVVTGVIEAQRAAVLRGRVLTRDGALLSGAHISVLDHTEFGQTLSRLDGMFDLAVNGGGPVTLVYQKDGFLPAQRVVDVPWQDFVWLPDVVLIEPDANVTEIDLSAPSAVQIARGSVISDTAGVRQATLLFPPSVQAVMTLPGGVTQTLTLLHVRATEYTVGDNGPLAMPSELPPNSAYTYATEFSVDEALAVGASMVSFSLPVISYHENFLAFPIGTQIPLGYYDQAGAAWLPAPNGRVVKILSIAAGLVELDIDGSGQPASAAALAALGVSDAERAALATLYPVGQGLWRAPIAHFTPWDQNMAVMCQEPCSAPRLPAVSFPQADRPCHVEGSIIGCQNQTLGEAVELVGVPHLLHYQSDRVPGRLAAFTLRVPLSQSGLSPTLQHIYLEALVAGQRFMQTFQPLPDQETVFTWDGRDAYGRVVQGQQTATVRVGYAYPLVRGLTNRFGYNGNGVPISVTSLEIIFWQEWSVQMGVWAAHPGGLGGWSFAEHHAYNPAAQTLHLGDGQQRQASNEPAVIATMAGNPWDCSPATNPCGDGGPATSASLAIDQVSDLAVGPDGSLFIANSRIARVRRVAPDGIISTVAGTGVLGFSGDGGPATAAQISVPTGLDVGADGSLYIVDRDNHRVRRVGPNGIITTVAGNGVWGSSGDGGPATAASIRQPNDVAIASDGTFYISEGDYAGGGCRIRRVGPDGIISTAAGTGGCWYNGDGIVATQAQLADPYGLDVGPDGSLYLADRLNARIRRIGRNGIINTVAGNGQHGFSGDGGLATAARVNRPQFIAVGPDGSLVLADTDNRRVRWVSPEGIISTAAGNGAWGFSGDGGPAPQAQFENIPSVTLGPDNSLYIAHWRGTGDRVRRVRPALPGYTVGDIIIPAATSDEVYVFDSLGRHQRTLQALTGAILYSFVYDSAGRLATITDGYGNITTIERNDSGDPTGIVGPYGQRSHLTLDGSGYLASITDPAAATKTFGYTDDGLLTARTDAGGQTYLYDYDTLGRLLGAHDPAGGGKTLARTETNSGYAVTLTTALTRTTVFSLTHQSGSARQETVVFPNGVQRQTQTSSGANRSSVLSSGVTANLLEGPDPRWGMNAPLPINQTLTTPAGRLHVMEFSRSVSLSNPADPFSLITLNDTSTVNNRLSSRTYTGATRTFNEQTPQGRPRLETINTLGQVVWEQSGGLSPANHSYDSHGRLLTTTVGSGPAARQSTFGYDAAGRTSLFTNPLGQTLSFGYDAAGRVVTETQSDGSQILYAYDANGNLTALTPPGRPAHSFSYTPVNLLASYTPPPAALNKGRAAPSGPASNQTVYQYNTDRQLTGILRPDGREINYTYDAAARLILLSLERGVFQYNYHPVTGQIATISAPGGVTLDYQFDGNLPTQTTWAGPIAGVVRQEYDNGFRRTSLSVSQTVTVAFQYDNDDLVTGAGALSLTRHAQSGLLTGSTLGGVADAWSYNSFGEPIGYSATYNGSPLYAAQYTRDAIGRISAWTETIGGVTTAYSNTYSVTGQLTQVWQNGVVTATYSYDANSNRLSRAGPGGVVTGTYDLQDKLLQYGGAVYTYNAGGELHTRTSGGQTTTYAYDELGNLITVSLPSGVQVTYLVDGQQRRVGRRANGILTQGLLYQDALAPVAELDGAGHLASVFVYATRANTPDYIIAGGETYRVIADHVGSPRLIVAVGSGVIAQRLDYDDFGHVIFDSNPGFQPFGFAGGLYDAETRLTRFGARDYDAATGRWTAPDPILFQGDQTNLYSYVNQDPVNLTDADGQWVVNPVKWVGKKIAKWLIKKAGGKAAKRIVDKLFHDGSLNSGEYEEIRRMRRSDLDCDGVSDWYDANFSPPAPQYDRCRCLP